MLIIDRQWGTQKVFVYNFIYYDGFKFLQGRLKIYVDGDNNKNRSGYLSHQVIFLPIVLFLQLMQLCDAVI